MIGSPIIGNNRVAPLSFSSMRFISIVPSVSDKMHIHRQTNHVSCQMMASSFNDREDQTRRMCGIMHNTVDRRLVLISCFMHTLSARVAVTSEAWEVAARYLKSDAVSG